jgi:[ribosomal protein S5]-alanine N-acetyltransferase
MLTLTLDMSIFLETERLVLHTPALSDLDNMYALESDPEVMEFIGGPYNKIKILHTLKTAIQHQEKHQFGFGPVYEKGSGEFVGTGGLVFLNYDDNQADIEIGYALGKKSWGKGYATELSKALIQWGFQHLAVNNLCAVTHPDNVRSRRVLEKSGMEYAGRIVLNNKELDLFVIYSG